MSGFLENLIEGAGGAATGGSSIALQRLLLPLLMSFGPAAISKIFGGQSPEEQLRDRIAQITDPFNVAKMRQGYYGTLANSPSTSQALGTIATGSNNAVNAVRASMGARGIGQSGTADIAGSMGPAIVGGQQSQLYTALQQMAQQQTDNSIQSQIAALMKTYGQADPTMQMFGAGMNSFMPILAQVLGQRFPQYAPQNPNVGAPGTQQPQGYTPPKIPQGSVAQSAAPTGSLQSTMAGASSMDPNAMSTLMPGTNAGLLGGNSGVDWKPPAVRVKGALSAA